MRSCFVLLFASLLTSCEAQGTIEPIGFVLKGRDLLLKIDADPPEGLLYVDWKINKNVTLVRFESSGKAYVLHSFTVRFPENKFSVILKNLQEVDSGVYSAVAVTSAGDKLVSEYKVTVQGPVSPVELTVDRVDSSSESCDLHVTCRTHNADINSTFRCVDQVCSQEGGEGSEVTTSGASLQVYLLKSTIICNHRNKVHWTQDLIPAEPLCLSKPDPLSHSGLVIAICILTLILFVVLFIWFYRQRRLIRDGRSLIERIQNAAQISRSHQDESPEDPDPDLGRRIKDLVDAVLLEFTSAPHQDESPEDPDSGCGKTLESLIKEGAKEELKRQLLDLLNNKVASREKMTERERQLLDHLTKEAASKENMELTSAPLLNENPADDDSDSQAFLTPRLSSPIPQDENSTSAPLLNESRADPNPGLGGRFVDLVNSGLLDENVTNISVEPGAESTSLGTTTTQTNVHPLLSSDQHETHQSNIKDENVTNISVEPGTRWPNIKEEPKRHFLDPLNQKASLTQRDDVTTKGAAPISAPHQKLSTPVYAEDVGKGSEDLVHAHLLDKIVTNSSEDPDAESKSLDTTTTQTNVRPPPSSDQHETHKSNTKGKTPAPPQKRSPAEHAADLGRGSEALVRAVVQDKKGTNSSEEAGAESKSLDTTTQTVVQPLLSSDQHGTGQSNIKGKTSASPQKRSPAEHAAGGRFVDLVNSGLLEELDRQWLVHLNKKADSGEEMTELERRWLDELNKEDGERQLLVHLNKKKASGEKMTKHERQLLYQLTQKAALREKTKRDRRWLERHNKEGASGEKMEDGEHQLLVLLTQKAALREKTKRQLLDRLNMKMEMMEDHERQLLDHLTQKAASKENMEDHERQLLDHLTQKAASKENMTKHERQLLVLLTQKAALREKEEHERQLLDLLTQKAASGEKMKDHERQLLYHLNEKEASKDNMTKRDRRWLERLNKEGASGEKMDDGE